MKKKCDSIYIAKVGEALKRGGWPHDMTSGQNQL